MIPEPRRLRRDPDGALVAGVCAGLARYLNIDRAVIRIAFVVLTLLTSGLMAMAYGFAWVALPMADPPGCRARPMPLAASALPGWSGWEPGWSRSGFCSSCARLRSGGAMRWYGRLCSQPEVPDSFWRQLTGPDRSGPRGRRSSAAYRIGFGVALVLGSALLFLYVNGALDRGGDVVLAVVTVLVVLALVLAPVWVSLGRRLADERAARIRSQERAEVAAHLHDSVLQTLAMMQETVRRPAGGINPGPSAGARAEGLAVRQVRRRERNLAGRSARGNCSRGRGAPRGCDRGGHGR